MEYVDTQKIYVARESKSGTPVGAFKNLAAYDAYAKSVGCETKYPAGTSLIPTGFLEFAARDPVTQAKYDAMSPSWEGPKASEGAITAGAYNLDFASRTQPSAGHAPSGTSLGTLGIRDTARNPAAPRGR